MATGETEQIKLTNREIAIAQGEEPDDLQLGSQSDITSDASAQPDDEARGSEAGETGDVSTGGDDAATQSQEPPPVQAGDDDSAGEPDSWVDEGVIELGSSYGLSKEDLESFSSREEFEKAARLADRQLATAGRQAAQGQQQQPAGQQTPPAQQQTPPADQQQVPEIPDLDPQNYIDEGYDDNTVALVKFAKAMKDRLDQIEPAVKTYQQQIEQERAAQARRQHEETVNTFHESLDELDPELFGRHFDDKGATLQLTAQADANRRALWEAAGVLANGMVAAGKPVPTLKVLLKRAHQYAFAEEITKRSRAEYQKRIAEQSKRRRGSSGMTNKGKDAQPPADLDDAEALANHPDIVNLWNKMQDENG